MYTPLGVHFSTLVLEVRMYVSHETLIYVVFCSYSDNKDTEQELYVDDVMFWPTVFGGVMN
jgi:hypothetical protein